MTHISPPYTRLDFPVAPRGCGDKPSNVTASLVLIDGLEGQIDRVNRRLLVAAA
jgi:hypothetical protein